MEYIKENIKKFSSALTAGTTESAPANVNPNQAPSIASPQSFTTAITPYSPTIYHHRRRRSSEFVDAVGFSIGPPHATSHTDSDIERSTRPSNFTKRHNRSVSESSYSEYSETQHVQKRQHPIPTIAGVGGQINPAFIPSTSNIRDLASTIDINTQNKVYREQYWAWSCKCQSWTKCEKILLVIIAVLFIVVCVLVTLLAIFAEDIQHLKDNGSGSPPGSIAGGITLRFPNF